MGPFAKGVCFLFHVFDNIWATYNLVVFLSAKAWTAYGLLIRGPYVAHMFWTQQWGGGGGRIITRSRIVTYFVTSMTNTAKCACVANKVNEN